MKRKLIQLVHRPQRGGVDLLYLPVLPNVQNKAPHAVVVVLPHLLFIFRVGVRAIVLKGTVHNGAIDVTIISQQPRVR